MSDEREELFDEPIITINGVTLTNGAAMTLRVAIGSFAMSLRASGLGEGGEDMSRAYLGQCAVIERLMVAPQDKG